MPPSLVITFAADKESRGVIAAALEGAGTAVYLGDMSGAARAAALRDAAVVLAYDPGTELSPDELPLIAKARLLQFISAGVDHVSFAGFDPALPVAANSGAFAEPIAEHAVAMALAAAKRLIAEHRQLERGIFNKHIPNRLLAGGVCGLYGFGGIGKAVARLMRGIGMRIHAIERRPAAGDLADWTGGPDRIHDLLQVSDVFIVGVPHTRETRGRIAARELGLMKPDAILVNVARAAILDEGALYDHLRRNPRFTACLDVWWDEPAKGAPFEPARPFLELPNVIGSPHNSATIPGVHHIGLRHALANCRLALEGSPPRHLINDDERIG